MIVAYMRAPGLFLVYLTRRAAAGAAANGVSRAFAARCGTWVVLSRIRLAAVARGSRMVTSE